MLGPLASFLEGWVWNWPADAPLLAIVLAFTLTLGARKLTERQGRVLKLLSGLMMLGLGAVLLVAPDRLSSLWTGVVSWATPTLNARGGFAPSKGISGWSRRWGYRRRAC